MGSPFAEFIKGVSDDYLLGKIGRLVCDGDKVLREVKRLVLQARRDKRITKDQANEACEAIRKIGEEGSAAEVLCSKLYECAELGPVGIEWCDLTTRSYDTASRMFVKKLWPGFVKAVSERVSSHDAEVSKLKAEVDRLRKIIDEHAGWMCGLTLSQASNLDCGQMRALAVAFER